MRWILRLLLFWAVCAPLFYIFGMPYLIDLLSQKARDDAYAQCEAHLKAEALMGAANSPLTVAQGEGYCHCLSDKLAVGKADLKDMLRKRQPAALTATAKNRAQACNDALQESLGFGPRGPKAAPVDQTHIEKNADGSETLYIR